MDKKESGVEELERMFTNESAEPHKISYSVIESITKHFHQEIGRGGYGTVYLGALQNDVMVAVKQLHQSNNVSDKQFLEEINCLKRVRHENIVRFVGYCAYTDEILMNVEGKDMLVGKQKRFLCFEYAPNGTLHDYLQEKTHGHEWSIHYKIIKGICKGVHYLHEKRINHLDLKPANILLGAQMEPKITDFGLSRCNDGTQSTMYTIHLLGTLGYIAPELIGKGKISFKSDIYSLGIIMIRLLIGRNQDIPENWHELLNVGCRQMERCIEIARICVDEDPYKRPTISEIICKLIETETTIENVPPVITTEPRDDPTSPLYQNVKIFLALQAQTREYYRMPEKLPVERLKWKLAFHSPPKLPIITGEKIVDANRNPLEVILMDADTGKPSAFPDVLQIELVPLLGNFPRGCWDADDFQRGIVEDLVEKHPLLDGEYRLTMWDGRATVNELMFTDDSLMCGCMFRIGVRVVSSSYHRTQVLEAMTEAFMVKGHHVDELHYKEHYKWELAFQSQPQLPIYVGSKIKDAIGNPLEIIVVDTKTGSPSALPMELDIQLVPMCQLLDDDKYWWSYDEFDMSVVNPGSIRTGAGPLLSGDISLTMKDDGRVTVNELWFTASSYQIRIGIRVISGGYNQILDGMTKVFTVKNRRNQMGTKQYPPALGDEVWRLKGISWGGVIHKRLARNNIRNVQDFLRMLVVKPDELRAVVFPAKIIGDGREDSTWAEITSCARDCVVPLDKMYSYSAEHVTIYMNSIFIPAKVEFGGVECPLQKLAKAQKRLVQQALREAYEHRRNLPEVKQTWKLMFKSQPRLPINAGSWIVDDTGYPLEIILVDAKTGSPSTLQTELQIQVVPLLGDFPPYEDWSAEEFRMAIVKRRQENVPVPLLKGDVSVIMRNGRVIMRNGLFTLNELQFTDSSSWVRCRKFRIGACVVPGGSYDGTFRILEAMTEAFVVGDLNRKHYPPVAGDPVWRLETIDKYGAVHRKLTSNSIDTVQEFHRMLMVKPDELHAIVRDVMTYRMWAMATSHASTCVADKVYAYSGANATIYLDSIFSKLFKIEIDGVDRPLHLHRQLDWTQTMLVPQLIREAYEHRHSLQKVGAAMELRDDCTIDIIYLLRGTSHDVLQEPFNTSDEHKNDNYRLTHCENDILKKGNSWTW